MLTADLEAKISDFGLSRLVESQESNYTQSNTGPLRHMSPESIRSKKYSSASDVWGWGVLVFETLTGEIPYKELNPLQAATEVVLGKRLRLPEEVEKEWGELSHWMTRCFATEPSERPSMDDLCTFLSQQIAKL